MYVKMRLGPSDHKQTGLNTSVKDHQGAFKTHSHKPLGEVVGGAFDYISFVV